MSPPLWLRWLGATLPGLGASLIVLTIMDRHRQPGLHAGLLVTGLALLLLGLVVTVRLSQARRRDLGGPYPKVGRRSS